MRNLWLFISKYSAFFFFIIFFVISLLLVVRNNSFQRASALNSSAAVIGNAYTKINDIKSYLTLGAVNDSLAAENARLRNQLKSSFFIDSLNEKTVNDTLAQQQYTYVVAQVINNSIHQKNNYITINKGRRDSIKKGMGVICPTGIVGIVLNVSEHYSTIQSLLHSDTRISASITETHVFGSLVWGEDNADPQIATLNDIPNNIKVKRGQHVVTSGFSLFPNGIPIGKVVAVGFSGGQSFLDIKVRLSTNFATLSYVYIVKNSLALEQQVLESQNKKNE